MVGGVIVSGTAESTVKAKHDPVSHASGILNPFQVRFQVVIVKHSGAVKAIPEPESDGGRPEVNTREVEQCVSICIEVLGKPALAPGLLRSFPSQSMAYAPQFVKGRLVHIVDMLDSNEIHAWLPHQVWPLVHGLAARHL